VIVFNITDEIPNDVVVARGELPDSLKQAVYDATVKFLSTDEGVLLFDEIYGWTGIRPAVESDFDVVREAAAKLGITED
jgi:ABC-type phosphate/phosphonate transport system substrate-binding protein